MALTGICLVSACGGVDRDDAVLVRSTVGGALLAALSGDGQAACAAFTDEAENEMLDRINAYNASREKFAGFDSCAKAIAAARRGPSDPGDREAAAAITKLVETDSLVAEVELDGDSARATVARPLAGEIPLTRINGTWLIASAEWFVRDPE